jgi:hypothetical protein
VQRQQLCGVRGWEWKPGPTGIYRGRYTNRQVVGVAFQYYKVQFPNSFLWTAWGLRFILKRPDKKKNATHPL